GLAAAVAAIVILGDVPVALILRVLMVVATTALAMIAVEVFALRSRARPDAAVSQAPVNALSLNRLVRKAVGLAATVGPLSAAYALSPESAGGFYEPVRQAAWLVLPWALLATPFSLVYVDRRQRDPEDAYAELGSLLTAQQAPRDWGVLGQH